MNNIMVCVTKQKTCQRLIDFGKRQQKSDGDQLFIIHVAKNDDNFLGNSKEIEALEYLYEKSRDAGANLTVEKADDVVDTLAGIVKENQINKVIVGQTGEQNSPNNFLKNFEQRINGAAELIVVPSGS